uniref:Fibronectin type-III domain-containing protein n=1 Tax=Haemonchus contortus TaxID=6289 RepID=W6NQ68_HAECO
MAPMASSVTTEYIDAHSIRLQIPPHPEAFAYIFEYATVSTRSDEWYYAGSSANPTVTFTILDPCRDYKFRGYSDSDIYGYEAPALYPVQCHISEDDLPQPKIEIVKAGGRLVVLLPPSVLEARCRLWVEVRMLPRCVRLEPFNIQKNIEIDCRRNADWDICREKVDPVCMEIQDISGKNGQASLTWFPPLRSPLYYHVRYGPAQIKGNPPSDTWQIDSKRDIRVDATVSSLTLNVFEDQPFGVQVCAIFNQLRKRPKFSLARVTPFLCTSCKKTLFRMEADLLVGRDGQARHSVTNISLAQVNMHAPDAPIAIEKAEEINLLATTLTVSSTPATESSTASTNPTTTTSPTTTSATPSTQGEESPLPLAEESPSTPAGESSSTETTNAPTTTSLEATSMEMTTETDEVKADTAADINVIDVVADLMHSEPDRLRITAADTFTGATHSSQLMATEIPETLVMNETSLSKEELSRKLDETITNLEKALDDAGLSREFKVEDLAMEPAVLNETTLEEEFIKKAKSELFSRLESSSAEVRHHEKSKKCLLSTGIVCNFGCKTSRTCYCPPTTHFLSPDGGCVSQDSFGNVFCLPGIDVNATWDPISMNLMIRSAEVANHIRSVHGTDQLFVEFGRVIEERIHPNGTWEGPLFDGTKRTRMVIAIEKLIRSGAFMHEPFVFHVNQSLNAPEDSYGISFCTFNSSKIKDPYKREWYADMVVNRTGSTGAQAVPISLMNFIYDVRSESALRPTNESFWSAFFAIGKIMLLVVLVLIMFVLVYMNCSRIRLLYDRKRTHYFRPYYIDPQVHVSPLHPYVQKRTGRSGFYQSRTKVM